MRYVFRTEDATLYLKNIVKNGNLFFIEDGDNGILCRICEENERVNSAPDAVLSHDGTKERLMIMSRQFKDAESAFACVEHNNEILQAAMAELEIYDDEVSKDETIDNFEPKALAYDYLFNYFGGDKLNGKVITGASVSVAIRPYKNGSEIKFVGNEPSLRVERPSRLCEDPIMQKYWLCDLLSISFDRENLFTMRVDEVLKALFLHEMGWDDIKFEVVARELDYLESEYISVPFEPSESEWNDFLRAHLDDFDIEDNSSAQCLSCRWIE